MSDPTLSDPILSSPPEADPTGTGPVQADLVKARRARPEDAAEVARLRDLMSAVLFGPQEDGPWSADAVSRLARWFADPDARTAAFVVDAPDGQGLATSAIGVVYDRLPGPRSANGAVGYVYGVSTDPRWQRRGYSRAVMTALLEWFDQHAVTRIELHASEFGEGLYRQLGFGDPTGKALVLHRR